MELYRKIKLNLEEDNFRVDGIDIDAKGNISVNAKKDQVMTYENQIQEFEQLKAFAVEAKEEVQSLRTEIFDEVVNDPDLSALSSTQLD